MQIKINGNAPFQVLATNFSISPSAEGYTLQISADGINYSNLFSVGAGVTRMVSGVANGSYYRCSGNESEITVNWERQCNDGQGGGSVPSDVVRSDSVRNIVKLTQEEYDALETKDESTFYIIVESV